MDTRKVRKLLRTIETAERKLRRLERARGKLDARIATQRESALKLKRQLARELGDVLVSTRGGRKLPASGRRGIGLSEALLTALRDGKEHSLKDLREGVVARGLRGANVGLMLSYLAKKGRVKRVGRGKYVKA